MTLWGTLVWGAALCAGCGLAGPTGVDVDDPGRYDSPLEVASVRPDADAIAPDAALAIRFDQYLDDDSFTTYATGTLASGGRRWPGWADYRMVDKALIWQPRSRVPRELDVQLSLSDDLRSVTGSRLEERRALARWRVERGGATARGAATDGVAPAWSDVDAIFDRRCGNCHAESNRLPRLTPEGLVGVASAEVDRPLVRPYAPANSYLMHKLLWDYPDRRFSPQPPPWDGGEELPRGELRTIEAWIASGAAGP